MEHLFISRDARQRESWRRAFPDFKSARLDGIPPSQGIAWVLLPSGQNPASLIASLHQKLTGCQLVVLADEPSEDEAIVALTAGASGYCNSHAAPQILQKIATVIENGGVWVGGNLMQRFLSATARIFPQREVQQNSWRKLLTPRELEVALALAKGASNKEIAAQLNITERTVKSHVSAILDKLGARDRLQLSLIINGVS
ncbi:MAG: response regulator transcription factor [Pseudomonadota bacterium]